MSSQETSTRIQVRLEEKWHSRGVEDVMRLLNTKASGLSDDEAKERLEIFGFNELVGVGKISPLRIFLNQFKSILILILIAATAISIIMGEEVDAIVIFAIVLISSTLGFFQEYRSEKALEALKKMLTPTATVIRNSQEKVVPLREIVPGDIIVLKEGDKVPADARLAEAISLYVNEASLTGESMPVLKESIMLSSDVPVPDRRNMVFSGTEVVRGKGRAVVVATGMNTEFGRIARHVTETEKEETPLEKRSREIGKWLGVIALVVVVMLTIVGILRGMEILEIFMFSVALAVAAVPEALPAVVTGSLAIGIYRMAKRNALVRKMPAVETLGSVTVICSDKTGTITKGEMTVRQIYVDGRLIEVTGVGYEPKGELRLTEIYDNDILNGERFKLLMVCSILCNDANLVSDGGKWYIKGDPTEGAFLVVAAKAGFNPEDVRKAHPRVYEVPFSSERKLMTTIHTRLEQENIFCMKGAPEKVLEKCTYIYEPDGIKILTDEKKKEILNVNEKMAENALRVLGVAYKITSGKFEGLDEKTIESDMVFLGLVGMMDPPREEAIESVKVCKQVGIKTVMITGDHKLTAVAVAKETGIFKEGDMVLTGEELDRMSDEELDRIVEKVTVYARVSPEHKLRIVNALKKKGHIVAMTGDGVNDAPALKRADIGVAMGITGTEVAKESSDMVLADDDFATIVKAIELGRWIYDNIKKYLAYLLQANLTEILFLASCVVAGLPLPLLPVQILYVNLATDGLPAIALGTSPPDPDIMKRPPRNPKESIFTREVKLFILPAVIVDVLLILWVFLVSMPLDLARTRVFIVFISIELTLAFTCRSLQYSIINVHPHKFLFLAVLWEILLLLILISFPITRQALGVTDLDPATFWLATGASLVTLVSIEGTKFLVRRNKNHKR